MCDRCASDQIQDEVHALFMCRNADICALRVKYAYLFSQFSGNFSVEHPYLQQHISAQVVHDFLLQHNNKLFSFMSELMDFVLTGEDQSQADQSNSLAEGPPM